MKSLKLNTALIKGRLSVIQNEKVEQIKFIDMKTRELDKIIIIKKNKKEKFTLISSFNIDTQSK